MNNYSGTYFAAITMFLVPALMNLGFSGVCANEIVTLGVPAVTALTLMVWRWSKGNVALSGKRLS